MAELTRPPDPDGLATWALVVGIDDYDDPLLRRLTGAVNDAVAAVTWLRRLGVPDDQIQLHAVPSATSRRALDGLGIGYRPASEPEIWSSIMKLMGIAGGQRLFVFLCGHGLFEPTGGPMFLTQEASAGNWVNLGIDWYLRQFRSLAFTRQFVFMDGCLNQPYPDSQRPQMEAGRHTGAPAPAPRAGNSLVLCCAASQDQLAGERDGRGVFTQRLLDALDPDAPLMDAVHLSFETGELTVNLAKVHETVRQWVSNEAAALRPAVAQTPQLQPHGAATADPGVIPVYRLPNVETCRVSVDVSPPGAAAAVEYIEVVFDEDPPHWSSRWPLPGLQLALPLESRLPKGAKIRAAYRAVPQLPWDPTGAHKDLTLEKDASLTFEFQPRGAPPAAPPGQEYLAVKLHDPRGGPRWDMSGRYEEAGRVLGVTVDPDSRLVDVGSGIVMEQHEDGPEFFAPPTALAAAHETVERWSRVVRDLVPDDVVVSTREPAHVQAAAEPNLELRLPRSGAEGLAGVLATRTVMATERPDAPTSEPLWRAGGQMSLSGIADKPTRVVAPGPTRIRLDLPWGSWSRVVEVPDAGPAAVVDLPDVVGVPPLRVKLRGEVGRRGRRVIGVNGLGDAGVTGRVAFTDSEGFATDLLVEPAPQPASWVLHAPRPSGVYGWGTVQIDGPTTIRFPLWRTRDFAVEWSADAVRVEPLSAVPAAEWDLLLSAGRLEDLTLEDTETLALRKWEDEILGLASAYAYSAAAQWAALEVVLGNLDGLMGGAGAAPLDLAIIAFEAAERSDGMFSPPPVLELARFVSSAAQGEVPLLRWGIRLALALLPSLPRHAPALTKWGDHLREVERRLALGSVWTVWRADEAPASGRDVTDAPG